jgi:tetratricopeptide (TPR) repeat protein
MAKASLTIGVGALLFAVFVVFVTSTSYPPQMEHWAATAQTQIFLLLIYYPLCIAGLLLGIAGRKSITRKIAISGAILCAVAIWVLPMANTTRDALNAYKIETDPNIQFEIAKSNADSGDLAAAIVGYTKAINLDPKMIDAYLGRANAYNLTGQFDNAIADYSKVLEIEPDSSKVYGLRADMYLKTRHYVMAADDYTKIITLEPENATAYNNRAYIYIMLEKYTEAMADCDKALELEPDYAYAYKNRGLVYKYLGQINNALKDFSAAIQLSNDPVLKKIVKQELYEASTLTEEPPSFTPPAERIVVTYPRGGESWLVGDNVTITWTSVGVPENATVVIMLEDATRSRQRDIGSTRNTGSFQWSVTDTVVSQQLTACMKITAFDIEDYSGLFEIRYPFQY